MLPWISSFVTGESVQIRRCSTPRHRTASTRTISVPGASFPNARRFAWLMAANVLGRPSTRDSLRTALGVKPSTEAGAVATTQPGSRASDQPSGTSQKKVDPSRCMLCHFGVPQVFLNQLDSYCPLLLRAEGNVVVCRPPERCRAAPRGGCSDHDRAACVPG